MVIAFWFSLGFNIGFVSAAAMIMLRGKPASSSSAGQELEDPPRGNFERGEVLWLDPKTLVPLDPQPGWHGDPDKPGSIFIYPEKDAGAQQE